MCVCVCVWVCVCVCVCVLWHFIRDSSEKDVQQTREVDLMETSACLKEHVSNLHGGMLEPVGFLCDQKNGVLTSEFGVP